MIYKTDYHMHSSYSDGRSVPEDYIAPAIAAGLSEIGFSEHLTLFKDLEDWNMNPVNISPYINHLETLRKNTKNIKIKIGLEVDFFAGKEKEMLITLILCHSIILLVLFIILVKKLLMLVLNFMKEKA